MNKPNKVSQPRIMAGSVFLASLILAGSILWTGLPASDGSSQTNSPSSFPVVSKIVPGATYAGETVLGNPKAKVLFAEYADYQCPFCQRFYTDLFPQIKKDYIDTGKIRFVYRNYPFIGAETVAAGSAAECAREQNKFWQYHDALFTAEIADGKEANGNLTRELFLTLADKVGLNSKKFTACLDSKKYEKLLNQELTDAQAAGVEGTPTSFVNGEMFPGGLVAYEKYQAFIDKFVNQ